MAKQQYKKLYKGGSNLIFSHQLFLGEDHLLIRKSSTFNYHYRRFFYRDIQAIYLRGSHGFLIQLLVWGAQLLLAGLLLMVSSSNGELLLLAIWAAIAMTFLFRTLILGPTCKLTMETATQSLRIPVPTSRRRSQRVMDSLKTAVEATQGKLTTFEIEQEAGLPPARRKMPRKPSGTLATAWHWSHFPLWLINAMILAWGYLSGSGGNFPAYVLVGILAILTVLVAMGISIRRRWERNALAWATYMSFALILVKSLVAYVFIILIGIQNQMTSSVAIFQSAFNGRLMGHPGFSFWLHIEGIASLIIGVIGIMLCKAYQPRQKVGGES